MGKAPQSEAEGMRTPNGDSSWASYSVPRLQPSSLSAPKEMGWRFQEAGELALEEAEPFGDSTEGCETAGPTWTYADPEGEAGEASWLQSAAFELLSYFVIGLVVFGFVFWVLWRFFLPGRP